MLFDRKWWQSLNSRPALYLARRYPSDRSLSFLGGTPIMPADMAWPIHEKKQQAKPFLAQINLADLPRPLSVDMPAKGILYFFFDIEMLNGDPLTGTVCYAPDDDQLTPSIPREPIIEDGDGLSYWGGWTYPGRFRSIHPFLRRKFPKYEIEFVPFPYLWIPAERPPWEQDRDVGPEMRDRLAKRADVERNDALRSYWGDEMFSKRQPKFWPDYTHWPLLDPTQSQQSYWWSSPRRNADPRYLSPIFDEWPQTWNFVALHLLPFFDTNCYLMKTFPDGAFKSDFLHQCETWVRKAQSFGELTKVSETHRAEYRDWVATSYVSNLVRWRTTGEENIDKTGNQRIWHILDDNLRKSALDAMTVCIDAEVQDRSLISQAAQDDYLGQMDPDTYHQMFGCGQEMQNAVETNSDKVLLLQLGTDYPMLWMFGDCGNLQFWISKEDLAQARFDNVTVTMEGY